VAHPGPRVRRPRSQRRAWRQHSGLTAHPQPLKFRSSITALYLRYQSKRHSGGGMDNDSRDQYSHFLQSRVDTRLIEFRDAGQLVMVSIVDYLPDGLSSVYTSMSPTGAAQASALQRDVADRFLPQAGPAHLYLGYWIRESPKRRTSPSRADRGLHGRPLAPPRETGRGVSLYALARPLLFSLDPETAHRVTCSWQDFFRIPQFRPAGPGARAAISESGRPGSGLDKNAEHIDALAGLGFGFIEVGTVTPRPQPGNPKPRLFRLPQAQALVNRFGFNNVGVDAFMQNVSRARWRGILVSASARTPTPRPSARSTITRCASKSLCAGFLRHAEHLLAEHAGSQGPSAA